MSKVLLAKPIHAKKSTKYKKRFAVHVKCHAFIVFPQLFAFKPRSAFKNPLTIGISLSHRIILTLHSQVQAAHTDGIVLILYQLVLGWNLGPMDQYTQHQQSLITSSEVRCLWRRKFRMTYFCLKGCLSDQTTFILIKFNDQSQQSKVSGCSYINSFVWTHQWQFSRNSYENSPFQARSQPS